MNMGAVKYQPLVPRLSALSKERNSSGENANW